MWKRNFFIVGFGAIRKRSFVSAVCGAENARVPAYAREISPRGRHTTWLPWWLGHLNPRSTLRDGKGRRICMYVCVRVCALNGVECRAGEDVGNLERATRRLTMGTLSSEIWREHAGWSVHCFNVGFRRKTYRLTPHRRGERKKKNKKKKEEKKKEKKNRNPRPPVAVVVAAEVKLTKDRCRLRI